MTVPGMTGDGTTSRALTVVIHDVATATMPACLELLDALAEIGSMPVTLLVVPKYHGVSLDRASERRIEQLIEQGHEVALHGWFHHDDTPLAGWTDYLRRRWYTAGEGEFAALDEHEATRRLEEGRRWFAARAWPLHGFVAPAWLMSAGTQRALLASAFTYTATLSSLIALPSAQSLTSQSIVYSTRSAWRRGVSRIWNAAVARTLSTAPLLRFELHPPDARYAAVRASWRGLLAAAFREREALTTHEAVRRLLP
ncbi:polysaccharide deacetylase family protein [Propionivibrio soli]|uniref:polysaccharide deacetylase family protein n=1 Tax=Propionivibrio soli TaxID=2976531 RepID=UPI0021E7277B|nr:polysaccharide deacetylase family protein [Propionivibrio soli]